MFTLIPGKLTWHDIVALSKKNTLIQLDESAISNINQASDWITTQISTKRVMYGVNTGFGKLAHTSIATDDLSVLQRKIILSHAAGVGEYLADDVVRLVLLLKINSLARGYSGVRLETVHVLIKLYNAGIYPCIPSQGSVGASGDLAPLAHLSTVLIGVGSARYQGKIIDATEALSLINCQPLLLAPKEGLALLNGTQVSTALAIYALIQLEMNFHAAIIAGAMSIDAARGSTEPLDSRIHEVRGHAGQITVANLLRHLLQDSEIRSSHIACNKVQDPYCLRCQPQVMGACLQLMQQAKTVLTIEANAVSDNPLIFEKDDCILSGGNFHAEPVAFAADQLALAIAEIGSLSERRTALLIDPQFSLLPPFLVNDSGVNSGFMIAQVTAAALVSENKGIAHPASVDSIPTSANQEDHVSMATYAARRLLQMNENLSYVIAIELLTACQGVDFLKPLNTSPMLDSFHKKLREHVSFYSEDRYFAPDIEKVKQLMYQNIFSIVTSAI